ncbi:MAG TPA: glycosyltransferase [Gemmatimonadaceae bacterium]|nr:glycosyltransferase [Gemmatimonadaceae bacterium]
MSRPASPIKSAGSARAARHKDGTRLLALVQRRPDVAPNQRFRHEQWAPHLERAHGITMDFAPFESTELAALFEAPGRRVRKLLLAVRDSARRWIRRHDADRYDAVVVVREATMLGGAFVERALAAKGVPLIYDFDDAIFLSSPDGASVSTLLLRTPWKVAEICRLARAVTVGNDYLAAFARRRNDNVHIVRTSIDLDRYKPQPERDASAPFTVVWSGSKSTLQYLDTVRPALAALAGCVPAKLRVVCNARPRPFEGIDMEFVPWAPATEVAALADSDVGIMPLPDTETSRGKCALKALQYMAVGRAAVVSPVGMNRHVIRHNENGLLADDTTSWVSQLERLARDPALRRRLAASGRRTIETGYSAEQSARALAGVVRNVLATEGARPFLSQAVGAD